MKPIGRPAGKGHFLAGLPGAGEAGKPRPPFRRDSGRRPASLCRRKKADADARQFLREETPKKGRNRKLALSSASDTKAGPLRIQGAASPGCGV